MSLDRKRNSKEEWELTPGAGEASGTGNVETTAAKLNLEEKAILNNLMPACHAGSEWRKKKNEFLSLERGPQKAPCTAAPTKVVTELGCDESQGNTHARFQWSPRIQDACHRDTHGFHTGRGMAWEKTEDTLFLVHANGMNARRDTWGSQRWSRTAEMLTFPPSVWGHGCQLMALLSFHCHTRSSYLKLKGGAPGFKPSGSVDSALSFGARTFVTSFHFICPDRKESCSPESSGEPRKMS
ncbi:uncharacterized protein LOC104876234 [Fukomys damarensis]|uniref:uncharacterized protein LOC104876234 n=1 Tax=Fukomys damarensis TaxID=885580 RepID=UPI00053F927E|nr:uncharacterized protein LOC104876234 [Fukomys damarensis]